jgi:hypothetical protein
MAITRITGTQTKAILKLGTQATAYGTAVAGGTGDRIRGNISPSYQSQELTKNPIGSGLTMQDDVIKGRLTPTVTLAMDLGFQNGADKLAAQFFSTTSSPAEQNAGKSDYLHRFTMNVAPNNVFATFAYELTTAKVAELPSCAVRSFATSFGGTNEIVQLSAELLGNDLVLDSATNTNATISSATVADSECVIVKLEDQFLLNTESGDALDSGDQFNIVSYSRTINRPQDFSGQVKGSAGNPKPLADEMITGTLSVTLEALDDISLFEAWDAETSYKCALIIEGSATASGGDNRSWAEYTPRMKLVQAPQYNVTDSGYNSVTLNFVIMQASANPTGMSSTLPYVELINTKSTNYILAS